MFSLRAITLASVLFCLLIVSSPQPTLPTEEVNVLKQIAKTLRKTNWDFSVDPCSGDKGWNDPNAAKGFENGVICNCSFADNTICHVTRILLKSQNLTGTVPAEMASLPYLEDIDLTRNYLNGTIPPEWGSMKHLVNISLLANRVSGSIPKEIAQISTLVNLTVQFNQLSGNIPPELGDLPRLEKLHLSSNYFTGELPETLAKLSTLKDVRISDNQLSGSIPNFIQNWTNLYKLVIQGSGLSGPIPSGIVSLTKLTTLIISDLNGNASSFPLLTNAKDLNILILRSCNIVGQLEDFLARMQQLTLLDLSFNKLAGQISEDLSALSANKIIYLTGNQLTGPVPIWIWQNKDENIDLSYNNLTVENHGCDLRTLNLFSSTSKDNTSGIAFCLRNLTCPRSWHSLYINCGGEEVRLDNGKVYEGDSDVGSASMFFRSQTNWAFSSTGHFLENIHNPKYYILKTGSSISGENSELYITARISPLSFTYYGFCLKNGNYTVSLHFAEIVFTDDQSYASLGRRMFDVYIQGMLVLKDFNIKEEAGGINKAKIRSFTAVVTDTTLEIRFYWAGKGTNEIPNKGVYGSLVSAISVDPDFPVPSVGGNSISVGAITGIVIGVLFITLLLLGFFLWKRAVQHRNTVSQGLKGLDLHTGVFTLRQIKAATNNFDRANKIGQGGFGSVYKGLLSDGTIIAVKQLSSKSKQGNREFVNEIGMISALQHPNLVKLYGCCVEGNQLLLVYEYMENNCLARALFGPEEYQLNLNWTTRHKICIGIARGLAYLHEESTLKIVHRDIKATNVLLDKDLDPKISDFGLAKLDEEENSHISTRIAGTLGYMAPEYAMRGRLTDKADVYSFGIVALEIVSGRSNTTVKPKEETLDLLDWALILNEKGNLMELVDPKLGSNFNKDEVLNTINVALLCANVSPAVRPSMSTVVSMLEGRANIQAFPSDSSTSNTKTDPSEKKKDDPDKVVTEAPNSQLQSVSTDTPWPESSVASSDLYPLVLDSEYLENRV